MSVLILTYKNRSDATGIKIALHSYSYVRINAQRAETLMFTDKC